MKRFAMILCLMGALLGQKGFANYFGSECNGCSDLSFSVYADYLYWKVTRPDHTQLVYRPVGGINHLHFLQPKYSSGYRVGGAVYFNCVDFAVRYTSLQNSTHASFLTFIQETRSLDHKLNYQVVDLAFGYTHYFQCHRGYLRPYAGAKLAWLDENFDLGFDEATSEDTASFRKIQTRAYGPMLGIEGSWELLRCWLPISLIARGDVSVLSGSFAVSDLNKDGPDLSPIPFDNKIYSLVAVNDLFIGLGIDLCNFSCFDANFQIGYEAQVWNGVTIFPEFSGAGAFGTSGTTALGLAGLVARLGVMF